MNTVTRKGIFETNSSSTHSITICGGQYVPDKIPLDLGVCSIFPGEFGWEIEDYYDSVTKASYALTWIKSMEENYGASKDAIETWTDMLIQVIKDAIPECTHVEFVENDLGAKTWGWKWGYIDHQSIESGGGVGMEAFESLTNLRDFIFNKKSELHTDNDNH